MNKKEAGVLIALVVTIVLGWIFNFAAECKDIREKTLRLHIIANSNDQKDQELKLKVRDRLLEDSLDILNNTDSKQSAKELINKRIAEIEEIANKCLAENNSTDKAKAEIVNMYFTTREYENRLIMPAGYYDALRITIGSGKGENWWCVMFPPLCVNAATKKDDAVMDDVYTPGEQERIKGGYEIRFKIVELFRGF